ncbi:NfeD family protein [uncultured Jatrophihabitans sp.]|uniref:NfeD family protein n=1 Tax=uncultured Jatrophihabitans sp. TaxID=1610747 RepID=UPI0035C9530C
MPDWLLWLIAAGVFAAAEAATLTLVLLMVGGGAAAAAVTAALGGPVLLQFAVAIVVTFALLGVVRPVAQRHMLPGSGTVTGAEALIGRTAVVLSTVDATDGRVRLNGAEWSARSLDEQQVLPAGREVRVVQISGATAVVYDETDDRSVAQNEEQAP